MKIEFENAAFHVSFRNKSERVAHDDLPEQLRAPLLQAGVLEERALQSFTRKGKAKSRIIVRVKTPFRRYVKLRPPTRISHITTTCTISDLSGQQIATDKAFYSQNEEGPFNTQRARHLALARALKDMDYHTKRKFIAAVDTAYAEREAKSVPVNH